MGSSHLKEHLISKQANKELFNQYPQQDEKYSLSNFAHITFDPSILCVTNKLSISCKVIVTFARSIIVKLTPFSTIGDSVQPLRTIIHKVN